MTRRFQVLIRTAAATGFPEFTESKLQEPDVYKLADYYIDNPRLKHERKNVDDYIMEPRDEDGYRSLHIIFRYQNKKAEDYNGLLVELQIRTKLQHYWATAVETMGTFLGQALKSRQGDQKWLDFFAVISSAFTIMENSPIIPKYSSLTKEETHRLIYDSEKNINAIEMMGGLSLAANVISKDRKSGKASFYHLIVLNSIKKTVEIKAYDRESIEQAMTDYAAIEYEAAKGNEIEPVLVSAGPLDILRRAYPNFFLDINQFSRIVKRIISGVKL